MNNCRCDSILIEFRSIWYDDMVCVSAIIGIVQRTDTAKIDIDSLFFEVWLAFVSWCRLPMFIDNRIEFEKSEKVISRVRVCIYTDGEKIEKRKQTRARTKSENWLFYGNAVGVLNAVQKCMLHLCACSHTKRLFLSCGSLLPSMPTCICANCIMVSCQFILNILFFSTQMQAILRRWVISISSCSGVAYKFTSSFLLKRCLFTLFAIITFINSICGTFSDDYHSVYLEHFSSNQINYAIFFRSQAVPLCNPFTVRVIWFSFFPFFFLIISFFLSFFIDSMSPLLRCLFALHCIKWRKSKI